MELLQDGIGGWKHQRSGWLWLLFGAARPCCDSQHRVTVANALSGPSEPTPAPPELQSPPALAEAGAARR